jgi:shikimate kinase
MGAGKTTIGRLIAKQLGMVFYDSDHEVERKTGVKIPLIFELEGESGFRKREASTIEDLCQLKNIVMATGGGVVLLEENRELLKNNGIVVYLRGNVHDLWLRTRNDKTRPLLQGGNIKQKLEQLYIERNPIYTKLADFIVDTGAQSAIEISGYIEHLLQTQHGRENSERRFEMAKNTSHLDSHLDIHTANNNCAINKNLINNHVAKQDLVNPDNNNQNLSKSDLANFN